VLTDSEQHQRTLPKFDGKTNMEVAALETTPAWSCGPKVDVCSSCLN
jgi:hypothetical protein